MSPNAQKVMDYVSRKLQEPDFLRQLRREYEAEMAAHVSGMASLRDYVGVRGKPEPREEVEGWARAVVAGQLLKQVCKRLNVRFDEYEDSDVQVEIMIVIEPFLQPYN